MRSLLLHLRNWVQDGLPDRARLRPPGSPEPVTIRLPDATPRLLLGLLAAYPPLIFAGYLLIPSGGGPAAVWPADAALFLAFLAAAPRLWGPIAVVAILIELTCAPVATWFLFGRWLGWNAALGYALAHVVTDLGPVLAARGMQRYAGFDPRLIESPLWLVVVICGVVPGAVLGDLVLSSRVGLVPTAPEVTAWVLGTALSIVLFAPALAIGLATQRGASEETPGSAPEAAVLVAVTAAIVAWQGHARTTELAGLPTLMLLMFPVSWLALRYSRQVVFLAIPAIACLLAYLGAHGPVPEGPVAAPSDWRYPLVGSQLSLLAVCGAALLISHIVHHQRRLLVALGHERLRLRWYASELERTEEDARQRIAAELHDGIAQALTGQHLLLAALRTRLAAGDASELLDGAEAASAEAQRHVRDLIQELRPSELEAHNLAELVQRTAKNFRERYPFRVELGELSANELPAGTLRLLFQALRELLFNSYHHSRGTCVHVAGHVAQGWARLEVHDDGIGFSAASIGRRSGSRGLGLAQLFERIESVGGTVELGARAGVSSLVVVTVPVRLREPPAPGD